MIKNTEYRVIIIGGGLAGLSLACIFVGKNIPTLIIDSKSNPTDTTTTDRRTTALMESSVEFIKNLGIWNEKSLIATPLNTMRIFQIQQQNAVGEFVDFNASDVGRDYLAYNVDNHTLRTIMCEKISSDKNIKHMFNTNATDMKNIGGGWQVDTNNSGNNSIDITDNHTANLIVGADGRHSFCRDKAGISYTEKNYNQSAIVFNVSHSEDHNNSSTEFMYPEGALTFVPIDKNESAVVWVETTKNASLYKSNTEILLKTFIKKSLGKFGTIKIISDVQVFPLNKIIAEQFYTDNLCLIGEAQHGITPVAAQGLNLSLRDTAVLGEMILTMHANGGDIADSTLLKSYEKKRRIDVKTRTIGTELFHKFSRQSDPVSELIKMIGIRCLNRVSFAKKAFITIGLSFPNGTPNYMSKNFKI